MYAGLDFGTSNCAIGEWARNQPLPIRIDGELITVPSALYTPRASVTVEPTSSTELNTRVAARKQEQAREIRRETADGRKTVVLSDQQIESMVRGLMRREQAQRSERAQDRQSLADALSAQDETVFGREAIRRHIHEPADGFFVKSPKSFIGAELRDAHLELFSEVITRMLADIKRAAEQRSGKGFEQVVLGRPVNFHGSKNEASNNQALGIMQRSAIAAGFTSVEFLYEPIAAAFDYERTLHGDQLALVLDLGGGTTDCSMVRVGPSYLGADNRDNCILGYAGERVGGTDIDIKLAFARFMPLFGVDSPTVSGRALPNSIFWDAVSVNDVPAQGRFNSRRTKREIEALGSESLRPELLQRLSTVHDRNYSHRLAATAETAKIRLTQTEIADVSLDYVENGLEASVSRDQFAKAIKSELATFSKLLSEVITQAGAQPDVLYVTGGTAKSPVIEAFLRARFRSADIVVGDHFGSVVCGLTTWAHRLFR